MLKDKKWVYLAGISALLAAGCAKEKPYDVVYKGENKVFAKTEKIAKATGYQAIPCTDPNDPCVYIPSNVKSNRKIDIGVIPYHMGVTKLVNFRISDDNIRIVDVDKETTLSGDTVNDSLALSVPVEHKDYRCKEDVNGDCGNTEEEVDDMEDRDKRFVEVDFEKMKVHEINTFGAMNAGLFGCASEVASRVNKVKIDNGALNLIVERDFKLGIVCLGAAEDVFRDSNFTVQYHYSFVPLSKLASKEYEKVAYTDNDHDKFGFFKTEKSTITVDNQDQFPNYEYFLNRWNPKKKEITYLLNDAFYKPKFKKIRNVTETAVANMNSLLSDNGVNLKIKLEDGRGKDTGDIRNNFITLIEDPQGSGILGYAPSAKNPRTGEIIHARANMYYGTIVKFVSNAYIEMYHDMKDAKRVSDLANQAANSADNQKAQAVEEIAKVSVAKAHTLAQLVDQMRAKSNFSNGKTLNQTIKDLPKMKRQFNPVAMIKLFDQGHTSNLMEKLSAKQSIEEQRAFDAQNEMGLTDYDFFSANNAYHGDLFNFSGIMTGVLNSGLLKDFMLGAEDEPKTLKNWFSLSQKERKKVVDIVMPFVWVPTLVHEIGHTLGLRHNFHGSVDKDNWYSEQELSNMGIQAKVPLSTVMDYPGTQVTELPLLGKYDIAALRFGYNREVDLENEAGYTQRVKIQDTEEVDDKPVTIKDAMVKTVAKETEGINNLVDQALAEIDQIVNQAIQQIVADFQAGNVTQEEAIAKVREIQAQQEAAKTQLEKQRVKLKPYMFCSDESVAGDPTCNRHDLGTNAVEIAKYYMDKLDKAHNIINKRNDRQIFGLSTLGYAGYVKHYMRNLRSFFEQYDNIMDIFGVSDEDIKQAIANDTSGNLDWLKDYRDATMLTADYLINKMSQPDQVCVLAQAGDQNQNPAGIESLMDLAGSSYSRTTTCFDQENVQPEDNLVVVGEFGFGMNDKKDHRATHGMTTYADQMDVRGTWMDKVMATRMLTQRVLGSIFDSSTGNYLDIPEIRTKFLEKMNQFVMNNVSAKVKIRNANGDLYKDGEYEISQPVNKTHKVNGSLYNSVNRYFGLMRGQKNNVLFANMLTEFDNHIIHPQNRNATKQLRSLMTVHRVKPFVQINNSEFQSLTIGDFKYVAGEQNVLAQQVMSLYQINNLLTEVGEEEIKKIIQSRTSQVTPAGIDAILDQSNTRDDASSSGTVAASATSDNPAVASAKKLPTEVLQAFIDGDLPDNEHLTDILSSLPNA